MPIFEYTGLNAKGKPAKGTIDADNERAARQKLRAQNIYPTEMKESSATGQSQSRDIKKYFRSERIGLDSLAICTRQLATLSSAGLPLVSALQALSEQTENLALKRILANVREKVEEGSSLAKAMAGFPKAFPKLYVNMMASGEASGTLDTVLENMAEYLESQLELRRKVMSALLYPILMLIICSLVITLLLAFVVPRIVEVFKQQGATLPLPTQVMIGLSNLVLNYWYIAILGISAAVWLTGWYYKQPAGRSRIDRLLLHAPIYGTIFVKVCTARVARTLGALLTSGVGLLTGLDITRNIISNVHIEKALEDAREGVKEGRSLAKELNKSGLFPPLLYHMVAIGEKSGELESMLTKAGKVYEQEVNTSLSGLTRLIEPLLMVIVGFVVLSIVISVLMPMPALMDKLMQQ